MARIFALEHVLFGRVVLFGARMAERTDGVGNTAVVGNAVGRVLDYGIGVWLWIYF